MMGISWGGGRRVYEAAGRVVLRAGSQRQPRQIKAAHGRAFQINARAPSQSGRAASEPMGNARRSVDLVVLKLQRAQVSMLSMALVFLVRAVRERNKD